MHQRAAHILVTGLIAAVWTTSVFAGAQARVRGVVTNTAGEPVPNAELTFTTEEVKGFEKKVTAGDDGSFTILILDATRVYDVTVEAEGYPEYKYSNLKVPVGEMRYEFDIEMPSQQQMQQQQQQQMQERPGYKELAAGKERLQAGDDAGAEEMFLAAVAERPDLMSAWIALTELAWKRQDLAVSLERAKKCLEQDPEAVRCLAIAANASLDLGDKEGHALYLARYKAVNPDDPATIYNDAVVYLSTATADDSKAKPLLEKCLEVDPEFAPCLFEYAMLMLRSGDMAAAKAHLEKYLEVEPEGDKAAVAKETLQWLCARAPGSRLGA